MSSKRIALRDAAKASGRSVATLRRWIREGRLKDYRPRGDRRSQVLVDFDELRLLLSTQTARAPDAIPTAVNSELADVLRDQIADLRKARDAATVRVDFLEKENRDLRDRITALERELNGGVRGLLRGIVARVTR